MPPHKNCNEDYKKIMDIFKCYRIFLSIDTFTTMMIQFVRDKAIVIMCTFHTKTHVATLKIPFLPNVSPFRKRQNPCSQNTKD